MSALGETPEETRFQLGEIVDFPLPPPTDIAQGMAVFNEILRRQAVIAAALVELLGPVPLDARVIAPAFDKDGDPT